MWARVRAAVSSGPRAPGIPAWPPLLPPGFSAFARSSAPGAALSLPGSGMAGLFSPCRPLSSRSRLQTRFRGFTPAGGRGRLRHGRERAIR